MTRLLAVLCFLFGSFSLSARCSAVSGCKADLKCYIMRGLPGSGKSTLARQIALEYEGAKIVSADNYFIVDGEYCFDASQLEAAHKKTQEIAFGFFKEKTPCVIIDNCNVKAEHMRFYVEAAIENGYIVILKEPETAWKDSVSECFQKTRHNVPLEVIEQMRADWEDQDK